MILTLEQIKERSAHPSTGAQAADEARSTADHAKEVLTIVMPKGSARDQLPHDLWYGLADYVITGTLIVKGVGGVVMRLPALDWALSDELVRDLDQLSPGSMTNAVDGAYLKVDGVTAVFFNLKGTPQGAIRLPSTATQVISSRETIVSSAFMDKDTFFRVALLPLVRTMPKAAAEDCYKLLTELHRVLTEEMERARTTE